MAEQELLDALVYRPLTKPVSADEGIEASIAYWEFAGKQHTSGSVSHAGLAAAVTAVLQRRASKMSQQPPVAVTDNVKSLQARIAELEGVVEKEKKPLVVDDKMVDDCMQYTGYLGDYKPFVKDVLCWYAHFANGNLPVKDKFTDAVREAFSVRGYTLEWSELKHLVSELRRIGEEDR